MHIDPYVQEKLSLAEHELARGGAAGLRRAVLRTLVAVSEKDFPPAFRPRYEALHDAFTRNGTMTLSAALDQMSDAEAGRLPETWEHYAVTCSEAVDSGVHR